MYVVRADGSAKPRNLTPGEFQLAGPSWTPDSTTVLVAGPAHDTWDLDHRTDVHAVDLATGERRTITGTTGVYDSPSVSPDGTRVAFLGTDDPDSYPRNPHVAVKPLKGDEPHSWISHALDRTFQPYPGGRAPLWLDDETILGSAEDRGNVHLYALQADGGQGPRALWDGTGCVSGYDAAGGTIAFTLTTDTSPGELYVLDESGPRQLTDLTSSFAEQAMLREAEHFTVRSTDGTRRARRVAAAPRRLRLRRQLPVAAERPRRAVHAVRQPVLRRGADAGPGRLRRALVEPPRQLRS